MYKILPILLFAYALAVTTDEIYDNSYALIIGIDKYENVRSLDYAVKDAEDIQSMLVDKFHFHQDNIVLLKNEEATKTSILQEFSNITKKAESNDRVLIYFAGHGETEDLPDGGEMGYLMPVDGTTDRAYATGLSMDELKRFSSISKAKHMLFLVDASFGGIASVGARGLDANTTPYYLDKITKNKSRQIITAGGRGEQVMEKAEWGHSAFTKNLLSGLRDSKADTDRDGIITAQELGTYLQKKVTIDSDYKQTPKTRNLTTDEGEFVFIYSDQTIINQNYRDKSTAARLDLLRSDIEALKSQKNITISELANKIPAITIDEADAKKEVQSKLIEIISKDGDNIKIGLDGITIKSKDGDNVKIGLDGITIKDNQGKEFKYKYIVIIAGVIFGLFVLIIILVVVGKLLIRGLKKIIMKIKKSIGMKKIYRNKIDSKIAGVCTGLGDYFEIEPVLIRLLFIVGFFLGAGPIVYIVGWIIIPLKD